MSFDASKSTPQSDSQASQLDAIVDAVCQGRLTPADVAGLMPDELGVLYALGQARLRTGQLDAAITLWSALVSLDPYQARAWRALGVGHHHRGAMREATMAYSAALYLEPEHALTSAYALEAHLLLGHTAQAEHLARVVRRSRDPEALHRLERLAGAQNQEPRPSRQSPPVDPTQTSVDAADETLGFCLVDGRTLPLVDSPFAPAGEATETTLVFDLAQAANRRHRPLEEHADATDDAAPASPSGLPPPLLGFETPRYTAPKERTVTGKHVGLPRVLPEATAARRMGMMLTDEITLGPDEASSEEATQAHHRKTSR